MFATLLFEARLWPAIWRRRLACYRLAVDTDNLKFFSVFGVLILGVIGIARFAFVDRVLIDPSRMQVVEREAARAQRRAIDLECLAENVYFEARGEPLEGQYAVAEVTLNRTRSDHFPHTVCGVVHEIRWNPSRRRLVADFSWTEQGGLSPEDGPAWKQAMAVAIDQCPPRMVKNSKSRRDDRQPYLLLVRVSAAEPGARCTRRCSTRSPGRPLMEPARNTRGDSIWRLLTLVDVVVFPGAVRILSV
jgi:N-acetylmuramoyl-L-alanine amidase